MRRLRALLEGAAHEPNREAVIADPVPGDNGEALERILGFYKTAFPDDWEASRLGPLCDGLNHMIAKLKG